MLSMVLRASFCYRCYSKRWYAFYGILNVVVLSMLFKTLLCCRRYLERRLAGGTAGRIVVNGQAETVLVKQVATPAS